MQFISMFVFCPIMQLRIHAIVIVETITERASCVPTLS